MKIDASDKPKEEESKREYLTVGEMKKLVKTDCRNDNVKRAFMFCCFTGLRYGDVKRLAWNDLHTDNNGDTEIQFKQQKTKGVMYLQVSNEALKWLPERNGALGDEKIFQIPINNYLNKALNRWVQSAGISKKITFHCSRHTAATLNLSLGVPIEVVSKLMGHTMIRTTQIYGKIVSEARRNAVNKQNGILDA